MVRDKFTRISALPFFRKTQVNLPAKIENDAFSLQEDILTMGTLYSLSADLRACVLTGTVSNYLDGKEAM